MIFFLALLSSFSVQAQSLEADLTKVLQAQGAALESFSEDRKSRLAGFRLTELVTNLSLSKSGVLGLSALDAETAVEIAWGRVMAKSSESAEAQLSLPVPETPHALGQVRDAVIELVAQSNKVKPSPKLAAAIEYALAQSATLAGSIAVTELGGFYVDALRLQLNFSAGGELLSFDSVKTALRIRLDWKLQRKRMSYDKSWAPSAATKLVVQTLKAFTLAADRSPVLQGFALEKIGVGIGGSVKTGSIGLWSTKVGFLGVIFLKPLPSDKRRAVELPKNFDASEIVPKKGPGPALTPARLVAGLERALALSARLSAPLFSARGPRWQVVSFKPSFELEQSGLFGLARTSGAAMVEVEYARVP